MAVTIKDIAERAGVSFSTVSKALRNSPLVQEKTRRKILAIAEEMGYRPNIAARRLVSRKSWTIGVAWPSLQRVTLSYLITRINDILESQQYTTLLSVNRMDKAIDAFVRLQVDAIVLFGDGSETEIEPPNAPDPVPILYYGVAGTTAFPTIDVQRGKAIAMAVRHLRELGHTDIAYVGGSPERDVLQVEKLASFRAETMSPGLACRERLIAKMDSHEAYWAAKPLLQRPDRPTAIISGSYDMTRGILRAAGEVGLTIPGDLSVVGYDLLPIPDELEFPVTSVGVQAEAIAESITHTLMRMIHDEEAPPDSLFLEPEIVLPTATAARLTPH